MDTFVSCQIMLPMENYGNADLVNERKVDTKLHNTRTFLTFPHNSQSTKPKSSNVCAGNAWIQGATIGDENQSFTQW